MANVPEDYTFPNYPLVPKGPAVFCDGSKHVGVDFGSSPDYTATYRRWPLEEYIVSANRRMTSIEFSFHGTKMKISPMLESMGRDMLVEIQQAIASSPRSVEVFTHPADWWQAFKERWYPQWALNRWPVAYTTRTVTARVLFPDLPPAKVAHGVLWVEGIK